MRVATSQAGYEPDEITPEMVAAGVRELAAYEPGRGESASFAVTRIFKAMISEAPLADELERLFRNLSEAA